MGFYDTLKDVVTMVQKTDNIELVKQVLSLQTEALGMQEENRQLRSRVGELEKALQFARDLQFKAPFYYAPDDKIPYCAHCWEAKRLAIHLHGDWNDRRWDCPHCGYISVLD